MQTINERWLQFAYLNSKGVVIKTALRFPFHTDLQVDQEFTVAFLTNRTHSLVFGGKKFQIKATTR
jgi:hypothetical protein